MSERCAVGKCINDEDRHESWCRYKCNNPTHACLGDLIAWMRDSRNDFFGNEVSEDIMPIFVKHGLAERVLYDSEKHGEDIDAEPGEDMIWRFTT